MKLTTVSVSVLMVAWVGAGRQSRTWGNGMGGGDPATRALRAAGLAVTAPRLAVYRVLVGRDRPAGAGEVYDLLRDRGSRLSLSSVYRALRLFVAGGIAHAFPADSRTGSLADEHRFRICDPDPHGHLVCEVCGRVIERPVETAGQWLAAAVMGIDFVPNVERSVVYGRCGRCRPTADTPHDRATRRTGA
jgi:Fur family ferric uptake transcriptional regulator